MNEREAALEKELSASRLEVKLLREKVDELVRMLYGKKSEKLDPDQLMLLEGLESKKAEERDPPVCRWMLRQIAQLYRIEAQLREQKAGPALRLAVRESRSAPILRRIKQALFKLSPRYLPKGNMGKAIAYAMEQWDGLELYLRNGAIEIDNNLVENAIRPTKLGMKNWLFIGSEASGQTSAILFTIIESAKRHDLEPYAYIRHLLKTLRSTTNWNLHKLAPAAYAKSQKQSCGLSQRCRSYDSYDTYDKSDEAR